MNATVTQPVPALGWALIHFLWQGALVGIVAVEALVLLRNARPQTRYAVSCAALALCLALPLAGVWRGMQSSAEAAGGVAAVGDGVHFVASTVHTTGPVVTSWQPMLQGQLPRIVLIWSIGAGLFALRLAMGLVWVGRIGRARPGSSDRIWQARLDRLAAAFDMKRTIALRVVERLHSPVAAGWWRPMVLVPAALVARMPADLLEALLAHELAHIKRHDYLVNLMQSAIETLLFYHPVVWWLSRQIRVEREQIADDLAAAALGEPRRLACALGELDQFQLGNVTFSTQLSPTANGGNLMSRIERLIRPNHYAFSWKMALPIVGLTALCLTVYAGESTPAATNSRAVRVTSPVIAAVSTEPVPAVAVIVPATPAEPSESIDVTEPAIDDSNSETSGETASHTEIHMSNSGHREDSFAMVRANRDGMTMSGDTRDIQIVEKLKHRIHGDFLWVRRGEKTYLVQDPAILAQAIEAWAPEEALDAKMEALDKQMEGPNQQMEALNQQMEALNGKSDPSSEAMDKTSAKMDELGQQQEAIGAKIEALGQKMGNARPSEREQLDKQMEELNRRMEPLNQQMEKLSAEMEMQGKEMERGQKPMEELGHQMEEAGKPMEAIGKQMDVLGKQIEQLSKEADQKMKVLIDEAMRDGKAVPVE